MLVVSVIMAFHAIPHIPERVRRLAVQFTFQCAPARTAQ
jgi:hypothetical protein